MARPAKPFDVLIVGAGIAGLMAARQLFAAGRRVLVIESAPVVGGRLATDEFAGGRADTGAQFFTVRTPEFQGMVHRWLNAGWVHEWSRGWSAGSLLTERLDGYPRYAARDGFAALSKRLAEDIEHHTQTEVVALAATSNSWLAMLEEEHHFVAQAVILTPPIPHSLAVLERGAVRLPGFEEVALKTVRYAPCLCGVFALDREINLPEPGALQRPDEPISWIADNRRKGISPESVTITLHASPTASTQRWDSDDEAILDWMMTEIQSWLAPGTLVLESALRRWPHAVPLNVYPARYLMSQLSPPLVFAGDAFDGPRVEGAALSGWAAANALLAI